MVPDLGLALIIIGIAHFPYENVLKIQLNITITAFKSQVIQYKREREKERGKSCTKDTQQYKQHIGIQLAEFLEINLRRRNQVALPTKCHFLRDSRNSWILKLKPESIHDWHNTICLSRRVILLSCINWN